MQKPNPIYDQNSKIDILFITKTTEKSYPFRPHIPIQAYITQPRSQGNLTSHADALRARGKERVTSLRRSAWEAKGNCSNGKTLVTRLHVTWKGALRGSHILYHITFKTLFSDVTPYGSVSEKKVTRLKIAKSI